MRRRDRPFRSPPRALRRPGVHLDNLAVVPANLLPFKAQWQSIANNLPAGGVLIVLPATGSQQRGALQTAANLLKAKGHHVTTISAERFA